MEVESDEECPISVTPSTSFVRKNLLSRFENSEDSGVYSITPGSREQSYRNHDDSSGIDHYFLTPRKDNACKQSTPDVIYRSINWRQDYAVQFTPDVIYRSAHDLEISSKKTSSTSDNDCEEITDFILAPVSSDNVFEEKCNDVIEHENKKSTDSSSQSECTYMDCEEASVSNEIFCNLPSLLQNASGNVNVIDKPIPTKANRNSQIPESVTTCSNCSEIPSSIEKRTKKIKSPKGKLSKTKLFFLRRSMYGFEKIDILYFLGQKGNFTNIVTKILSYLPVEDLLNVCAVSKTWEKICNDDLQARKRLNHFKKLCNASKENLGLMGSIDERKRNGSRSQFSEIQNVFEGSLLKTSSPVASPRTQRFQLFQKEGEKLDKKSRLMVCPSCKGPVRCNNTGNNLGKCEKCEYKFCTICLSCYHYPTRCFRISSMPSTIPVSRLRKDMKIGSKASLRRLSRT